MKKRVTTQWFINRSLCTNQSISGRGSSRDECLGSSPARTLENQVFWLPSGFFFICYPMVGLPLSQAPVLFAITLLNVEVAGACGCAISASVFDSGRASTWCPVDRIVFSLFTNSRCIGRYSCHRLHVLCHVQRRLLCQYAGAASMVTVDPVHLVLVLYTWLVDTLRHS